MIRTYRKDEHKAGFIGIRVAVMVNSKLMQKYYSFKSTDQSEDEILSDAKSLHAKWMMEKNLASSKRDIAAKELRRVSSPFSTGIKGIKFRISHNTCYFYVQGMTNKIRFHKNFSINKYGYEMAWFKACEFLQKNKDYSLFDSIYKNIPVKERLLIAFRYLYFTQKQQVHIEAIAPLISEDILVAWLKQLLTQFKNNKPFKAEVLKYMSDHNIKDSELLSMT
ncbi:AP2/ERF family transcription factor [uncultured Cocleimonas sp.]|uniref:AP2/ERF family transcription factor n=1 Tax=uncultured Cocleimonas sp. TaxID=1051587 RepID=UPI00261BD3FE|nr:AP2/ERF family transcription factor [uncultured Cocleimonas sp.]